MPLTLRSLSMPFYIHRLPPHTTLPSRLLQQPWVFVAATPEETSVLAPEGTFTPPEGARCEGPWLGWYVQGPLDFGLVGILAQISTVLASADVPILAISTYDTDYIWVPQTAWAKARQALLAAGYRLQD